MCFPIPYIILAINFEVEDLLKGYKGTVKLITEAMHRKPFMRFDVTMDCDSWYDKFYIKRALAIAFLASKQVVGLALHITDDMLTFLLPHLKRSKAFKKSQRSVIRLKRDFDDIYSYEAYNCWGAELIAEVLREDRHLLFLDASEAQKDMSHKALLEANFYESLQTSKICYLRLRRCGLEAPAAVAIAKVLSGHETLQLLDLSYNNLGDLGVTAIAQSLTSNTVLKVLSLNKVKMTSKGGCALANALRENECLELCYLQDDELDADTGKELASMLTKNATLKFLVLYNCGFGPDGCKAFVSALKQNRTLKLLILRNCGIAVVDKRALVSAAVEGQTLEQFDLNGILELTRVKKYEVEIVLEFRGAYRKHLISSMGNWRIQ